MPPEALGVFTSPKERVRLGGRFCVLFSQMAQANYSHLCSTLHLCRLFSKCWETDDHVCFCSCVRALPLTGSGRTICVFSGKFATSSEFKTLKQGLSSMFLTCVWAAREGPGCGPEAGWGASDSPQLFAASSPCLRLMVIKPESIPEKHGGRKPLYCQLVLRQVSSRPRASAPGRNCSPRAPGAPGPGGEGGCVGPTEGSRG